MGKLIHHYILETIRVEKLLKYYSEMTGNDNITIHGKFLHGMFCLMITLFGNKYYDRKISGYLNYHNNISVNYNKNLCYVKIDRELQLYRA